MTVPMPGLKHFLNLTALCMAGFCAVSSSATDFNAHDLPEPQGLRVLDFSDRGMWMAPVKGVNSEELKHLVSPAYAAPTSISEPVVGVTENAENGEVANSALNRPFRVGVQLEFAKYQDGSVYESTKKHLLDRFGEKAIQFSVLNPSQMDNAVEQGTIDFLIADGGSYTRYQMNDGMKSLASLWPLEAPDPAYAVGSLFISRADNDTVTKTTDFVGKKIGAFYPQSFSGYLIGLRDIYQKGVVIQSLRNRMTFFGDDPLKLAQAVENGVIDVGILPACRFERMVNAGQIDRVRFRLIDTRSSGLIHCAHSTELYPSFYFASAKNVDSGLQKTVSAALYTMTVMADGADWGMPVSNRAVHDLFFDLKIGPYSNLAAWQFATFAKEQTTTVMIFLGVSFLIIFYAGSLSVLVRRRTKLLNEALADRERIEKLANASRDHIANLERTGIVGQMSTMIAHELKQPLGAITNFANGLLRRSKRGPIDPKMMTEVLEEIVEQGTRASEIVNRVRAYAKHQTPELKMADMSVSVERAIETFKRSRRTDAVITKSIMPYLWADIDGWEIELAVLNLLKNAADALEKTGLPEIHVSVKPEDRFWRIEVRDNGPKITQEQVDKFMMPLVTSKEGGLGLGISIVGNIAERHHGRLTAMANPDHGVTMALDIPRSVMPEHTAI